MLIDLTLLEEICASDDEFQTSFSRQLEIELQRSGRSLREAWLQRDCRLLHHEAHKLKGLSFTVGARGLGRLCGTLEQRAREGHKDSLEALVRRILFHVERNLRLVVHHFQGAA